MATSTRTAAAEGRTWLEPKKVAIVVLAVSIAVFFIVRPHSDSSSFVTPDAPEDIVLLHQLGHGVDCPSLSPFVLKVETYLRINNIPYKSLYDRKMGPKGKTPWIEYNGDVIPDSSFIISYLNGQFKVNMNSKLTPYERGVAVSLQRLAEENLYLQLGLWRAVYDKERETFKAVGLNWFYIWMLERKATTHAWHHGIGRHSEAEVALITETDLQALSSVLGVKDYFFGDGPTEVDCALFGQLSQLVWQARRSPGERLIKEKFPNLQSFCERIRAKYWQDWNQLLLNATPSSHT